MTTRWLVTTAIAVSIGAGSGLAFAQSQPDLAQRHEQGMRGGEHRALSPREGGGGRLAAGEARHIGGPREHAAESSPASNELAKGPRHGEAGPPSREQAQEHQPRTRQTVGQGRQGPGREHASPATAEQNPAERTGRQAHQTTGLGHDDQAKQRNRAAENTKSPSQPLRKQADRNGRQSSGSTEQTSRQNAQQRGGKAERATAKQQPPRERNQRAQQHVQHGTPTAQQQGTRPAQTTGEAQQHERAGQAQNRTAERAGTASASTRINDQQRTQVVDRLRSDRDIERARTSTNIRVNVGERLPDRIRPVPLPSDIVSIVPEYRGYDYTVVEDQIAIIDPHSREIVDVIPERGYTAENSARYEGTRVVLTSEQRQILKRAALNSLTVGLTASIKGSNTACLTLQPVPNELVRSNPELASYRYVAIGDQVVLVDPQQRKIVQVID